MSMALSKTSPERAGSEKPGTADCTAHSSENSILAPAAGNSVEPFGERAYPKKLLVV